MPSAARLASCETRHVPDRECGSGLQRGEDKPRPRLQGTPRLRPPREHCRAPALWAPTPHHAKDHPPGVVAPEGVPVLAPRNEAARHLREDVLLRPVELPHLQQFYRGVLHVWQKWLNRRTKGKTLTWETHQELLDRYPLLPPRSPARGARSTHCGKSARWGL